MANTLNPGAPSLAFVGAGSLGQSFSALLAAAGQSVTLVGSERTTATLLAAGAIRLRGAVSVEVDIAPAPAVAGVVGVTADPARLPRGAGVIFCAKGHQMAAAIDAVRAAWPQPDDALAWVGGVQNGLAKDDMLAAAFGRERVVGAVTILGAERKPNGEVAVASRGSTYLGELDGGVSPRVEAAVAQLNAAGLPTVASESIQRVLWTKACNAVGVFGVTVLARISAPKLFRSPDLLRAYMALVRETAMVAAMWGAPVDDYTGFPIKSYITRSDDETIATLSWRAILAPAASGGVESVPSMTQDLLAGRALEVDEVFGDVVDRAQRVGVDVPRIRLVRDLIRGIDPGRAVG